jgi:gliding motility-associated-like protein
VTYAIAAAGGCAAFSTTASITITPSSTNTTNASACDSYTWSVNGQTYSSSGTYSTVVGCVTEELVLTITPSSTNTTNASACDSYTWSVNGQTYSSSGTYSEVVGCVTEELVLTITPSSTNTTNASACDSYTWSVNGQTYSSSGTYSEVVGCVTEELVLTIMSPGDACDDGDATTGNDVLDASCTCAGQPIDCAGIAGGTAFLDNCGACVGGNTGLIPCAADCDGVFGGSTLPGTSCDDGNVNTTGDTWNASCQCVGTPTNFDCLGISGGSALPGTSCDDGNTNTTGDTWNASCQCVGTPTNFDCLGISGGSALPGTSCDDGNVNTTGDTWNASCQCVGTIPCVPPTIQSITDNAPICSGSDLILNVTASGTGPLQYAWSGAGTFTPSNASANVTVSGADTGSYTVSVSNACGSIQSAVSILVVPAPVADAGPDATVCALSDSLHAEIAAAVGSWSGAGTFAPASNLPDVQVSVNVPGTYPFIWTVGDGQCYASDTVLITFIEPGTSIAVDAGEDQYLNIVTSTTLNGAVDAGVNSAWSVIQGSAWFANADDPVTGITGLSVGANVLVLIADNGACATNSDTVIIHVNDLFIPEGYSPNGDGVNDRFEITGISLFPEAELNVFNRWGQNVLSRTGYANDWEGRSNNGGTLPDDTYFYVLNLSQGRAYNGHIIIKR